MASTEENLQNHRNSSATERGRVLKSPENTVSPRWKRFQRTVHLQHKPAFPSSERPTKPNDLQRQRIRSAFMRRLWNLTRFSLRSGAAILLSLSIVVLVRNRKDGNFDLCFMSEIS